MLESKTHRSKLFKHYSEGKSVKEIQNVLGTKSKGVGIYALYKGEELVYVGITGTSLRGRLKGHLKDRLEGKWDNFSWYQIRYPEFLKDVETLILRIAKPPGNKVRGRFRSKYRK